MLVIVQVESSSETYQIEVPDEESIECLMQLIMIETGISLNEQQLTFNSSVLAKYDQSMSSVGISDGSTVQS
jgi:hypothetical protein